MTLNSGQLRNMTFNQTFQSSLLQKNNEKFSIDKSLIKGIKQNDVSKIIDQNQLRGETQGKDLFDEYKELSLIVIEARKNYDIQKTQCLKLEQQIQKLKSQKEILFGEKSKFEQVVNKQKKQLDETTKNLQEITKLMQATIYRKDIYLNLKDTVKHDLLVLKKRFFDKDIQLMRQSTKLKTLKNQHQAKLKLSKRYTQMLTSVEKTAHVKQLQRTSKIQSFCDVLSRKQANQQNRQIRQRQIQQAMISAQTDKLSEQKQWIRMFNANLFLKGMLKAKMQRLMNKYHKIQLSFHKMKQATSVKDSNQFIQRFLNREQTYGLLLGSISEKEKQLEQVKQQKDQLQKLYNNYLYKNQQMGQQNKNADEKNKNQLKNAESVSPITILQQLNQQLQSISRQKQLMYQWGTKFLAAYLGHSTRDQIVKKFPKTMKKQLVIQILKNLNKFLTDLQTQENSSKKIQQAFLKNNPKQGIMTDDMIEKNARIKTFSTYENDGGETFDEKDMAYDDLSQLDFIQYNRRAIKKSDIQNRKFRIKTKPN